MAQVTIAQLPQAQPLTGTETVPINQNGVTVQTTVTDIANSPTQQQTFITVNNEPSLPNSRQLDGGTGIGINDGGAQGVIEVFLNGASGSLENSVNGLIAKTSGSTVVGRSITSSGNGVTVTNGDGVSGNPVLGLTGAVGDLNALAGTGIVYINSGNAGLLEIQGTADEIDVSSGTGPGNPTVGIADNPILPGTAGVVVPSGTTLQRGLSTDGKIRYNTDTSRFEGYQGSQWKNVGFGDGTVTSVNVSGGSTGLTTSGGAITTSGTITIAGILNAASGGTGQSSYTTGDILYSTGATTLSKLGIGSSTYIMTSSGSAPAWTDPASIAVGNLAGGAANRIAYQTNTSTTGFIVAPTSSDTFLKWTGSAFTWGTIAGAGTVTSVGLALPAEFTISNSPVTSSGTLTGAWASQTANYVLAAPDGMAGTPTFRALTADDVPTAGSVANALTIDDSGAGDASPQTFDGSAAVTVSYNTIGAANSGANTNITSIDSITGGISTPDYINFDNALVAAPTTVEGGLYYNNDDNTAALEFVGNNGQLLKVNEEQYYRVKASSNITKGQVVMITGTVGASGGLIGAPATGLTAIQTTNILGVATESISINNWGYVTFFGEIKGLNTTGGGESWTDNTVLYYNPAVTGGLTKNKPAVPNAIAIIAAVVHANASNGVLFIRPTFGSVLGGTDGNVNFGTLSGGDIIVYDSGNQYWENAAQSTLSVGKATNLAGGLGGSVPYQSAADTTTFLAIGTSTYLLTSAGTAPQWSDPAGVTVGTATTATTANAVANAATFTNTGGAAPGATFDGSAARTIDYSTVGAPKADGTGASGTWSISINGNAATATSATSATSATTATNIAGGTAGALPYNSGAGTTTFLSLGTTNYVLTAGATAPQYVDQSTLSVGTATNATNVATTATSTNADFYIPFVAASTTSNQALGVDAGITYNPSTNAITAGISGGTF